MKKVCSICLLLLILINSSAVYADNLSIESQSAILIDSDTGQVLYEKNSHEKLHPASITKVMSMLTVMEQINQGNIQLDDEVTISQFAADMGGSQLYLEASEKKTIEELLIAVAVESANDASAALAEYIGGDYGTFVDMMNEKAKILGMKDTNFKNSNGLPDDDHYTSAYDIALMSKELMKYPDIHKYLTIWMQDITVGKNNDRVRTLANTNKLLRRDDRVDGIKTGYTDDAGYCLSATAKEGTMRLVSVVLNAPSSDVRFDEALQLLNYGFNRYKKESVIEANEAIAEITVDKGVKDTINLVAKESFSKLIVKSDMREFQKEIKTDDNITAPVKKDDKLGELTIKEEGKVVATIDLIAEEDVEKMNFFGLFNKVMTDFLKL